MEHGHQRDAERGRAGERELRHRVPHDAAGEWQLADLRAGRFGSLPLHGLRALSAAREDRVDRLGEAAAVR